MEFSCKKEWQKVHSQKTCVGETTLQKSNKERRKSAKESRKKSERVKCNNTRRVRWKHVMSFRSTSWESRHTPHSFQQENENAFFFIKRTFFVLFVYLVNLIFGMSRPRAIRASHSLIIPMMLFFLFWQKLQSKAYLIVRCQFSSSLANDFKFPCKLYVIFHLREEDYLTVCDFLDSLV